MKNKVKFGYEMETQSNTRKWEEAKKKHIYFTKSYCHCLDCGFECENQDEMTKHCKKNKHLGEVTLTKTIDFTK